MPNFLIHILSNIILLIFIIIFDKEYTIKSKNTKILATFILGSNLIDIDHLLADPIYDATRCSINFHPLHSWYMFPVYVLGAIWKNKNIRYLSLAIILHLFLDWMDCIL